MAEVVYSTATLADAAELEHCLRPADVAELAAAGIQVEGAVQRSVQASLWAKTVRSEGRMVCVFGVAPLGGSLLSDVGVPWMLGSNLVRRHQRLLMRHSRPYIRAMLDQFDLLLNYVHADNVESVRWLKRMGFVMGDAGPWGPNGALFRRFEMKHV